MAMVTIMPLPQWCREISERLWPVHPPIFDGDPHPEDIELALALIEELDSMSQRRYRHFVERHAAKRINP